jgi:hypothetical protein
VNLKIDFFSVVSLTGDLAMIWRVGMQRLLFTNSIKIYPDKRYGIDNRTSDPTVTSLLLKIDNVTAGDAGEYVCQVAAIEPMQIVHTLRVLGE